MHVSTRYNVEFANPSGAAHVIITSTAIFGGTMPSIICQPVNPLLSMPIVDSHMVEPTSPFTFDT